MNSELVQQILSYFKFNIEEIVAISILFILLLLQIYFYIKVYRRPYTYACTNQEYDGVAERKKMPKVSVIISSENEVDNLAENLPLILEQDYPDFEVIVVNDGSTDESDTLLKRLSGQYPNLYQTFLPLSTDRKFARHKLALTVGIKAAKGEVLLFTEPYCSPDSNQWIKRMATKFSDKTEVVLGYSYYEKTKHFANRIARFDNLLFSMHYLSKAIKERPYVGVYRNVAFKKELFFANKGFASFLNIENGEDIFINQIVNKTNTEVVLEQDSFVKTKINSYAMWRLIKKNYSVARSMFKKGARGTFKMEVITRYLFYILFIALIIYSVLMQSWAVMGIAILLFLIRLIVQLNVIKKISSYFYGGKFYFSLIIMDLLQPMYNNHFKTRAKRINGRK